MLKLLRAICTFFLFSHFIFGISTIAMMFYTGKDQLGLQNVTVMSNETLGMLLFAFIMGGLAVVLTWSSEKADFFYGKIGPCTLSLVILVNLLFICLFYKFYYENFTIVVILGLIHFCSYFTFVAWVIRAIYLRLREIIGKEITA